MKINVFGKIYIALMSVYFVISGFNALFDIDSKLARIGLSAIDSDGKIAFILIYCSLMIGIGVSIALLYYFSKTWEYSALLASIIIASFISFRLVGAYMVGGLSNTQLSFLGVELLEVAVGIFLLYKSDKLNQKYA
ncbi:MAG: hypothetical protein V7744_11840 [Pseudomonadales bacterium]